MRDKSFVTILCLCLVFSPAVDYGVGWHFIYHYYHANIFHCLSNLLFLWIIKFPLRFVSSYLVALIASFLPCPVWSWGEMGFVEIPYCGLSGVLMASVGIIWGEVGTFKRMCKYALLPVILTGFIPNVCGLLHLYTLIGGYLIGLWKKKSSCR